MPARPPFRADHVGSLLRPPELRDARAQAKAGALSAADLKAVEDRCIREAVAKQEAIGLESITDGEFRRDFWHLDFVSQLDGVALTKAVGRTFAAEDVPPMATVTGKVRCTRPIFVDHFAFLKSVARKTPKLTIPAPATLHFRGGRNAISREAYPDLKAFWVDAASAYRAAIGQIAAAGCTYLQLDDVSFSYLCDPNVLENFRNNGDDPSTLAADYANAINGALANRPAEMTVTMHTCRGNFRSTWFAAGAYQDAVIEAMFSTDVDGYFMEYDDERAGTFAPLRLLPKTKKVVLGLVTTKSGRLESKDDLRRRIDEAAKFVPLENLCLSPQCGFASTHHGNQLTVDEQWRKLERVVEVSREVWGG
ncbi:MAG TPA: 5-methyltetrahydropteroyltriglutamate--homocysteine S-methyltransferase [Burkholderiales bacterium]|nr:5-methyltetrahydropteroyltriglutamate--homocysteine S-methyltransferase [Burkholderiales bacterium]